MAGSCPSLSAVLTLVKRMRERVRSDHLPRSHPVRERAEVLHVCYCRRYLATTPECSIPAYVDAFIRAYAAWHTYTGED